MSITDNDIVNAIGKDPEKGFRMLVKKYIQPVYWHIRRLVVAHADAQDATQETFVRVYRSVSSLRDTKAFAAWIYRIATNEAMRIVQTRKTADTDTDIDSQANLLAADSYVDYSDAEAVKLQNAILRLPPKQQVVFNLRYYDEMSYDEIAKVADSTAAAAKTNYHLAKEKIIEYMTSKE